MTEGTSVCQLRDRSGNHRLERFRNHAKNRVHLGITEIPIDLLSRVLLNATTPLQQHNSDFEVEGMQDAIVEI